jgi:predicted phosphoadenosine phosphosulfate sulfurtransferase
MAKHYLDIDVLTAAQERISYLFDSFERLYVSFSGGKDSTVLMHLALNEARRRNRRIGVLVIDWEAQFTSTIDHIREMLVTYADNVDPYWVCLPLRTTNACSQHEPEWSPWDPAKKDIWVRDLPPEAISDPAFFPFYKHNDTFEDFVRDFAAWYSAGEECACLVGIRADESKSRYLTVVDRGGRDKLDPKTGEMVRTSHERLEGRSWTVKLNLGADAKVWNVFPIYDWATADIWTYLGRTGLPYNKLYDMMHKAGVPISKMRICEPYGDEQRIGLWLYHVVEPDMWPKIVSRVAGANTGALYSRERGNVMGNGKVTKPDGMTWQGFAKFLLDTMPPSTAEHYRNKIAVWLRWYQNHGYPNAEIPDFQADDTGQQDKASWRRVCKCLLKNDYWCKTIGFSPTKTQASERYTAIMARRREEWGII